MTSSTNEQPGEQSFLRSWAGFRTPSRRFLYRWAIADLAANILLVVTGGAVRVTDSGLGCPTWPQCTSGSLTPHAAMGIHGVIEFGNRMLTWVLVVVAIATFVAAMRYLPVDRLARRLALGIGLGVPLQAVVGGITVLTDLNPWIVSFHFLATMLIISFATWLVVHTDPRRANDVPSEAAPVITRITVVAAWAVYAVTWVTVYLGTVVTGSGPHAGDIDSKRNGLQPTQATQLHVDAVWTLVGISAGLIVVAVVARLAVRRATLVFGGLILLQGLLGYIQYATELPEWMVVLHMFGSALLMSGATYLLVTAIRSSRAATPVPA
ncbi:COX15/CtaA family protein [Gordonia sp. HY002]|uniref:COX15/CtaA family protein n=1 Tax=Gordonia zhenghanii TaxID=2911516 RepID=UPI001EF05F90|nr:COX15/CtaA family protein [Gordonia zhenghanii]MCF8569795.1 COX15/CtaA family protein [Gordonia zhenghanii]MCF8606694.1 COX15/CtaA family protein [Gordonia zhenghanii]